MATYKVIQDIEAEDKLIGPLTLKQFIYAIIVIVMGFVAFRLMTIKWYLALPFLPPMFLFGVLAAPFGRDQSTEVWLLAKVRFFLKPRRRIWDQTGMQELVTITAPKLAEHHLTNELSQTEVKSRLRALANTIDSRGWAIKNVNVNLFAQPAYALGTASSDRLIDPSVLPNEVVNNDIQPADDMLDVQNNPVAQQLDSLIARSSQTHRQATLQHMADIKAGGGGPSLPIATNQPEPQDMWFVDNKQQGGRQDGFATFGAQAATATQDDSGLPASMKKKTSQNLEDEDLGLLDKVHKEKDRKSHSKKYHEFVSPDEKKHQEAEAEKQATKSTSTNMTPPPDPAIINYANRDDLTVSTIARQLKKDSQSVDGDSSENEVVISLR